MSHKLQWDDISHKGGMYKVRGQSGGMRLRERPHKRGDLQIES